MHTKLQRLLEIREAGDPMLKIQSTPVADFGPELKQLARDLKATMNSHRGIGIAAIQCGQPFRVVVVKTKRKGDLVLVNPKIELRQGRQNITEGCLSFPGVRVQKQRSLAVQVEYQDLSGLPRIVFLTGVEAACAQHEIDHLDGVTIA